MVSIQLAANAVFPFTLHFRYKVEQAGIVTNPAAERSVECDGFSGELCFVSDCVEIMLKVRCDNNFFS